MNVIILGGGIAGLLASHVFKRCNPVLLEGSPKLGGNFAAGGLKYIRHTAAFEALLGDLAMSWEPYKPIGMLYTGGMWQEHPRWLQSLSAGQREVIQRAHWQRTRRTLEGFRGDCMNDPLGNGGDMAMRCDHVELIQRLAQRVELVRVNTRIEQISHGAVRVDGTHIPYDLLIPAIPLGALSKLAPWAVLPDLHAWQLNIVDFDADDSRAPSWDYMYTPMERHVTRVTWPRTGSFQAEVPGPTLSIEAVTEEVARVAAPFTNSLRVRSVRQIPGHLEPPRQPIVWPDNWVPLGRFTQWEPRATSERVLDTALNAYNRMYGQIVAV